jgi:type IV pilus assembly protein PilQ
LATRRELQGKSLLVSARSRGRCRAAHGRASGAFAESRNRDTQPIKDLDFRRGTDSSGRVIVDLANNQVGVDIRQQGQTLVVEFLKSTLPEGPAPPAGRVRLRHPRADHHDLPDGRPGQHGDRAARRLGAQRLPERQPVCRRSAPAEGRSDKLTQGPAIRGEKLSLNFQNIEVRSLLQVIADFTNFNIVTSDSVAGAVTLRLKDVPWDQALDIILQAKGLGMRKTGNVLWIAPKDEINAKEKIDLESQPPSRTCRAAAHAGFPAELHQGGGNRGADFIWHTARRAAILSSAAAA